MGIVERREREKTERRRTILNCAKELILEHGVEHISMDGIASKAELSKATVYLYFASKEDLLSEICEDGARYFCERLKILADSGLKGMAALRLLWHGYIELFGSFNDMIIIFQVRNYLDSWMPVVSMEGQSKSPFVDEILFSVKNIIDECKAEGVFDPDLDSTMATRLLLSIFSKILEHTSHLPAETRGSPAVLEEMINTFQIVIRGFAREGINHSQLDIRDFSLIR